MVKKSKHKTHFQNSLEDTEKSKTFADQDPLILAAKYLRHPLTRKVEHLMSAICARFPFLPRKMRTRLAMSSKKRDNIWLSKAITSLQDTETLPLNRAYHAIQNEMFPKKIQNAEKILIILVPEHNEMSGGIYSFFSIANAAYKLRHMHNYEVVLMTRPNKMNETYFRQRNFKSSHDVFRFEQIKRCLNAKEIYLHIPEYAASNFIDNLDTESLNYLCSRDRFYVNILNQKIDIMPEPNEFCELRSICDELTQSVAHHAYFGQSFADYYNTPLLLLPAYTDLSDYPPLPAEDKRKLIIYSPDSAHWKNEVLRRLKAGLPDYEFREIRSMTFDDFMTLATQCRYSVTFGEGFDGYLAQPIHQGGVGFAVYNDKFFPSEDLKELSNIFLSPEDMKERLVERIRSMDKNPEKYISANEEMMRVYDQLYSREDYIRCIEMLIKREFELTPLHVENMVRSVHL